MNGARAFSQLDPRWEGARLGDSALTIGGAGCLLCGLASLLAAWGAETDPAALNAWLIEHEGFAPGGRIRLGALELAGARLRAWVDYYATPANLRRIGRALGGGRGALALIETRPGEVSQAHWVRLLEVGGRDCVIADPWQAPGREVGSLTAWYGGKGWSAGRAIFTFAEFAAVSAAAAGGSASRREQEAVCIRDEAGWRS